MVCLQNQNACTDGMELDHFNDVLVRSLSLVKLWLKSSTIWKLFLSMCVVLVSLRWFTE